MKYMIDRPTHLANLLQIHPLHGLQGFPGRQWGHWCVDVVVVAIALTVPNCDACRPCAVRILTGANNARSRALVANPDRSGPVIIPE